ncbi:MAG: hypothetical protein J6Q22_14490 [Prevotella sp.]|jgi:hypothetical protein|nr:hypothetical protein [Prevotella sp.]
MKTQQDIINDIRKEAFVSLLKSAVYASFPRPVADYYCSQIDDVNHLSKYLEEIRRQLNQ